MQRVDCWVCCQEMQFHAVGSCGHNDMCMRCALRLRILLKDYRCPICKAELERVLITDNPTRTLEEYPRLSPVEAEHGFLFENREAYDIMQQLTTFCCWLKGCEKLRSRSFTQANLRKHIESFHKLRFCDICLKNRIVFLCEQRLYTAQELERHIAQGDKDLPGHPECLFCRVKYFDDQDLKRHLQEKHFSCGICEASPLLFYEDYEKLKQHFIKAHYFCQNEVCLQNRFVVFRSYIEFHHHNTSIHIDKTGLTRLQRDQLEQIPLIPELPDLPNTEAVDFTPVFQKPEEGKRPEKQARGPSYIVKKKPPPIPDYRNVFPRSQKEVKSLLMDAFGGDSGRYQQLLQSTKNYNSGQLSGPDFTDRFMDLLGSEQGEALFPIVVTTLRSEEKKEELHIAFTKYMERKHNVTADGRCSNELAECRNEGSTMKALQTILEKEMEKRRKDSNRTKPFYIHPSLLIQMASLVDGLEDVQMVRFTYLLNFGVKEETKLRLLNMLSRASDLSFCSRLTVPFEDYFLAEVDSYEIYVCFKYVDMCVCKLKGLPFRNDSPAQKNLETESCQPSQPSPPSPEPSAPKWVDSKKVKAPTKSEQNFPALAQVPASPQPAAVSGSWSKGPAGLKKEEVVLVKEEFPSLGGAQEAVSGEEAKSETPPPASSSVDPKSLGLKSVTVTKGKGRKKKEVTVIRLG